MCLVLRKNRWSGYSRSTPDTAVEVDGGVDHPLAAVGGPELGHGDLLVGRQALGEAPGGLPGGEPDGLGVDVGVGGPLAHRLEGGDRLAELLAVLGVLGRPGRAAAARPRPGPGRGRSVLRWTSQSTIAGPSATGRAGRRHRPRPRPGSPDPRAARCWPSALDGSARRPTVGTTKTATPSGSMRAPTSTASARCPTARTPSRRTAPSRHRTARPRGRAADGGRRPARPGRWSARSRRRRPRGATAALGRRCRTGRRPAPPRPGSRPPARRRRCGPAASASRPVSRKPSPAPPTSSGSAMPSSPAAASSDHSLRSKRSPRGRSPSPRSRSWVDRSVKIRSASSRTASCSSLNEKSMVCPLSCRRCGVRSWRGAGLRAATGACPGRRWRSGPAGSRWCRRRRSG